MILQVSHSSILGPIPKETMYSDESNLNTFYMIDLK